MKRLFCLMIAVLLVIALPVTVSANSAEPPGMIILTVGLPEDAVITLELPEGEADIRTYRVDKIWESQYRLFYRLEMWQLEYAVIRVKTSEKTFTCPLPEGVDDGYRNILTLDYGKQTLTLGQNFWRQPLLTLLRIALTLLVEGAVFFLFGFRSKRSWVVFLIVNLITQGWLNIVVNSYAFASGYWLIAFILMELLIFIAEMIAFPLATKEKKKVLCVLYALAANAASLAAGIFLIGRLPL